MNCRLCNLGEATDRGTLTRTWELSCPNCGNYSITTEALDAISSDLTLAFKLASWVSEQNASRLQPRVDQERVEWMRTYPGPSTERRAQLYLATVIRMLPGNLLGRFEHTSPLLQIASWSQNKADCVALARYLLDLGALGVTSDRRFQLVAKGHIIHEKWNEARAEFSQAFVAMWFDKDMETVYEKGFAYAIRGAGYAPLRVDQKEHDGKIDDMIIAEIRRSAFVIADFTGHRGGVYYEAGFAHGLGRRVIFTCRENELKSLHFDVRQYNTIVWVEPSDIIAPLQNRILALFGAGPEKRNAKPIAD